MVSYQFDIKTIDFGCSRPEDRSQKTEGQNPALYSRLRSSDFEPYNLSKQQVNSIITEEHKYINDLKKILTSKKLAPWKTRRF